MNRLLLASGITGFIAVALGAFGAHALDGSMPQQAQGWWDTATLYALIHSVATLFVALHAQRLSKAGWAFIIGTLIFSGSLYAMALGAPRWFGALTPIGGVSFLIGWSLLCFTALQKK